MLGSRICTCLGNQQWLQIQFGSVAAMRVLSQARAVELGVRLCAAELADTSWVLGTAQGHPALPLAARGEKQCHPAAWEVPPISKPVGRGCWWHPGNVCVKRWVLTDDGFISFVRRGTFWKKIRMKRKTFSCEFLNGHCRACGVFAA